MVEGVVEKGNKENTGRSRRRRRRGREEGKKRKRGKSTKVGTTPPPPLLSCSHPSKSSRNIRPCEPGTQSRFTPMGLALSSIKSRRPLSPSVSRTKTRKRKRHGTRSKPVHAPGEAPHAKKNRSLTNEMEENERGEKMKTKRVKKKKRNRKKGLEKEIPCDTYTRGRIRG